MFKDFRREAETIARKYWQRPTSTWLAFQGDLAALAYRFGYDHAPALRASRNGIVQVMLLSSNPSLTFRVI